MRDRQKKAEALAREATEQPAKLQARQQREAAEQRREFDAVLDDVFLVYDIRMERREAINGHETIVFLPDAASQCEAAHARRESDAERGCARLGQRV